jgi:hypothetical protein
MERRPFSGGRCGRCWGTTNQPSQLPAPDDIGGIVTRLRRQSLEGYDAAYVASAILLEGPAWRAPFGADDRSELTDRMHVRRLRELPV